MKKEKFFIDLFGCTLLVTVEIDNPSFGTYECPGDNGSIEITDINSAFGNDLFGLVEQIPNYEELIIDQIRRQL